MRLWLLILAFTSAAEGAVQGRASLEETYEPLGALVRTSVRASVGATGAPVVPYLLAGNEGAGPSQYPLRVNSDAYLFAAPGARVSFGDFTLSAEARFRKFYMLDEGQASPTLVDVQSLLVYEHYWDHPLLPSAGINLFASVYSETTFTSADRANLIHTTLFRAGPEIAFMRGGYIGAYVEPNFVVDRVHHSWNNRAELRFGGRVRYDAGPVEMNLTVCYLFNQYFKMKFAEEYLPPDRNQGVTAKLTLAVRY